MICVSGIRKVSASDAAAVVGRRPRGSVSVSESAFQLVISGRSDSGAIIQSKELTVSISISKSILSTPVGTDAIVRALELMAGGPVSVTIGSKANGKFSKPSLVVVAGLSLSSAVDASGREGSD